MFRKFVEQACSGTVPEMFRNMTKDHSRNILRYPHNADDTSYLIYCGRVLEDFAGGPGRSAKEVMSNNRCGSTYLVGVVLDEALMFCDALSCCRTEATCRGVRTQLTTQPASRRFWARFVRAKSTPLFGSVALEHPCWKLAYQCVNAREWRDNKTALRTLVSATAEAVEPPKICCTGTVKATAARLYCPSLDLKLALPLKAAALKQMISTKADRAPMGRGMETVVDLKKRKTWRIPLGTSDAVLLDDKNEILEPILKIVKESMRPRGTVLAVPYQLLVYEVGDKFTTHKDTLRGPTHFGSLVVELPVKQQPKLEKREGAGDASQEEEEEEDEDEEGGSTKKQKKDDDDASLPQGGDLIITTSKDPVAQVTSPRCKDGQVTWAAFVTDLDHCVTPLTRGLRCTLTYQLYDIGPIEVPRCPKGSEDLLGATLCYISHNFEMINDPGRVVLGWGLKHQYSENTLPVLTDPHEDLVIGRDPARLHGADLTLYAVLRAALDRVNDDDKPRLSVELATFRDNSGTGPHGGFGDEGVYDDSYDSRAFYEFENRTTFLNADEFENVRRPFRTVDIDTGNEGTTWGFVYENAIIRIGEHLEHEEYKNVR